ncbi:carbamoyl phosphate synthase small subunit [Candidatus Peregrinibacteria bacterium RIFOXYC2_FULL_33_13]|nr:MAG: carbamoyl phosphate synthase small subunit [Candidatus Peregrinibacteria bacterium RIFOXYC2_FULL_33_13]
MVGYPEAFTDPSYRGQILTLTYPLIGNYGIPDENKLADNLHENFESSEIQIKALLVTEYSENSSHWTAKISLKDWLKKNKIPAITGIDTRALTQKIREKGAMLGKIILNEKEKLPPKFFDPNNTNLVDEVSIKKPITYKKGQKHVVIIDYGIKNNIIRNFLERNISLTIIPWNYDPFEHNLRFDGLFLTNGPGDPMMIKESCKVVQKAMEKKMPIWGICMGNHILALSAGAKTYKLKYGHRSQNQPCLDLETGRCYITSQNHGYAVDAKTLPKGWKIWLINANDHTVEGIKHASLPFKSVQFHPEATPGPIDTEHFFDDFVKIL